MGGRTPSPHSTSEVPLLIPVPVAENQGMSEPAPPMSRVPAWGWILLVVPAALAIGWGLGQLPTPEPAATPVGKPAPDRTVAAGSGARQPAPPAEAGAGVQTVEVRVGGAGPAASAATLVSAPPSEPPVRNEVSPWTTLDLALAESRRTGKPVMIDFNADWCPPCRRMKQEVFEDGARSTAVQTAVIPVSIVDRAREDGRNPSGIEELQQQYQIDAFPTLVVFSPATGRVEQARGYGDADATVAWIIGAARSVR